MAISCCSDIVLSRYSSVAISFVHRTISRHAAHVAVSFVSQYRSVTARIDVYLGIIFLNLSLSGIFYRMNFFVHLTFFEDNLSCIKIVFERPKV